MRLPNVVISVTQRSIQGLEASRGLSATAELLVARILTLSSVTDHVRPSYHAVLPRSLRPAASKQFVSCQLMLMDAQRRMPALIHCTTDRRQGCNADCLSSMSHASRPAHCRPADTALTLSLRPGPPDREILQGDPKNEAASFD